LTAKLLLHKRRQIRNSWAAWFLLHESAATNRRTAGGSTSADQLRGKFLHLNTPLAVSEFRRPPVGMWATASLQETTILFCFTQILIRWMFVYRNSVAIGSDPMAVSRSRSVVMQRHMPVPVVSLKSPAATKSAFIVRLETVARQKTWQKTKAFANFFAISEGTNQ
jgi:hypothetical protein